MANGKVEKAKKILKKMAEFNGKVDAWNKVETIIEEVCCFYF